MSIPSFVYNSPSSVTLYWYFFSITHGGLGKDGPLIVYLICSVKDNTVNSKLQTSFKCKLFCRQM